MAHYNFQKDLAVARKSEEVVAEILENKYNAVILEHSNHGRYDIRAKIRGVEFTFEIKEDFMCEKTGNVSLEFECRGKPSGIESTEADFFVYIIHKKDGTVEYVMFTTVHLLGKVEKKDYFRIVNGGDAGSNTMNYLFKYNAFVDGSTKIGP